jgi:hypothetical protein
MPCCISIGATHRVDHASKFDDATVAGTLDYAVMVHGNGGVNQIAAQRAQSRQSSILVRVRETAKLTTSETNADRRAVRSVTSNERSLSGHSLQFRAPCREDWLSFERKHWCRR